MSDILTYYSYAKVNLGLKIVNKRQDGYHNIHSLFIELDLCDKLIFSTHPKFKLTSDDKYSSYFPLDDTNLISKAYKLMHSQLDTIPIDYSIHINKKIPIGSGLGGGSSNAAITLKALNKLWNIGFSNKKLEELGLLLGADIPFFINGGFQLVEGIGEILSPQKNDLLSDLYFLLIIPSIYISTKKAYSYVNKPLSSIQSYSKFPPVSSSVNWQLFENDFENVIGKTYPEIHEIKIALKNSGALFSGLSGSGSTVFGIFDNLHNVEMVQKEFVNYQTFLTSPVFHS